jgi:restriction system protein
MVEQLMPNKQDQLIELARLRQKSKWKGYRCIGDYHDGKYECAHVSPYTRSAGNVNAELMVLLQDWASHDVLNGDFLVSRCTIGHDPLRRTNINLKELLRTHFTLEFDAIYATNVFPFVKLGKMNAAIKARDLARAAKEFALPQIEIVAPRLAICLGKAAFNAIARAAGQPTSHTLGDAIASPFQYRTTQVWCQAHTGQQGRNYRNRDGIDRVSKDWARMATAFVKTKRC